MAWKTDGITIWNDINTVWTAKSMQEPFPLSLWRVDGGQLTTASMQELELTGAFANATELRTVVIPPSVKHIGRFAFRNTKLKEVTVAKDCKFYPTSFPEGCTVNFYPFETNFLTLDCKAFITSDYMIFEVLEE